MDDGFQLLYSTLKDGDILIIMDTISNINYIQDLDVTIITFKWTEENYTNSLTSTFEGNITDIIV